MCLTQFDISSLSEDTIAVATNSRLRIFVTIVICVQWCVWVFDPIYSGASLRLSMYV